MQWALVATVEQPLFYQSWEQDGNPVYLTITAAPGTIVNIIDYDGEAPYTQADGTSLTQVPDEAPIGDTGY